MEAKDLIKVSNSVVGGSAVAGSNSVVGSSAVTGSNSVVGDSETDDCITGSHLGTDVSETEDFMAICSKRAYYLYPVFSLR